MIQFKISESKLQHQGLGDQNNFFFKKKRRRERKTEQQILVLTDQQINLFY